MSMDGSPSYTKSRHKSLVLASGIREPPSYGLHTTGRHHSPVLSRETSMNPHNVLPICTVSQWFVDILGGVSLSSKNVISESLLKMKRERIKYQQIHFRPQADAQLWSHFAAHPFYCCIHLHAVVANTPAWDFSVRWRLWWWTHFLISPPCQYITDLKGNWWGDGTHFIQQFFCFLPRKLIYKFSGLLATLQVKLLEIFLFSFLQLPCMEHTPASSGASTSSLTSTSSSSPSSSCWCWGGRIWFCCHLKYKHV